MNSIQASEEPTADPSSTTTQGGRSYVLEVIGVLSAIGFFIGIAWAFQTQISGVVTQREFDLLQTGQSLAEVNALLGFDGTLVSPLSSDAMREDLQDDDVDTGSESSSGAGVTYVWENSSLSFVKCGFKDGRLTTKQATDLP